MEIGGEGMRENRMETIKLKTEREGVKIGGKGMREYRVNNENKN